MPKSSTDDLAALRADCFMRDDFACRWPGCPSAAREPWIDPELQMAHLSHRGMGGSVEANTLDNVITLCRFHHDIFDGRQGITRTRTELARMLRAQI